MFAKNLKYLRERKGLEQIELAQMLNRKSSSSISEWEKGKYTPKLGVLNDISKIFQIDIDDLMNLDLSVSSQKKTNIDIAPIYNQLNKDNQIEVYDLAEAKLKEQNMINEPKLTSIPVSLKVAASCNTNGYGNDNETAEFEEVYTDREDLRNFDYAYYVYGDSMEPKYKNYDVVLTQRAYDVDNGSIYVVMHNEELFIKQVRINDGIFTMHSLNPKYKDINIQLDDAESYPVIIGKVVDSITPLQLN